MNLFRGPESRRSGRGERSKASTATGWGKRPGRACPTRDWADPPRGWSVNRSA